MNQQHLTSTLTSEQHATLLFFSLAPQIEYGDMGNRNIHTYPYTPDGLWIVCWHGVYSRAVKIRMRQPQMRLNTLPLLATVTWYHVLNMVSTDCRRSGLEEEARHKMVRHGESTKLFS